MKNKKKIPKNFDPKTLTISHVGSRGEGISKLCTEFNNQEKNYNFSFSGIKTHINLLTKKNKVNDSFIRNVSASFQKTVSEIIISKLDTSIKLLNEKSIQIK